MQETKVFFGSLDPFVIAVSTIEEALCVNRGEPLRSIRRKLLTWRTFAPRCRRAL